MRCSDGKVFPCHAAHHEWCRAQWCSRKFRQHCTLRSACLSAPCTRDPLCRTRQAAVSGRRTPVARRYPHERDRFLLGAQNSLSWHLVGDGAGGSGGGGGIGGGGGAPAGQKWPGGIGACNQFEAPSSQCATVACEATIACVRSHRCSRKMGGRFPRRLFGSETHGGDRRVMCHPQFETSAFGTRARAHLRTPWPLGTCAASAARVAPLVLAAALSLFGRRPDRATVPEAAVVYVILDV